MIQISLSFTQRIKGPFDMWHAIDTAIEQINSKKTEAQENAPACENSLQNVQLEQSEKILILHFPSHSKIVC